MSERTIPLSTNRDGQAEQHQMDAVRAVVDRKLGDGWVTNTWPNRHLAGNIIQMRLRITKKSSRYQREIEDPDTALLQNDIVGRSITDEAERILGYNTPDGKREPGELDRLDESSHQLLHWLTLSADERQGIRDFFDGVAGDRSGATNPFVSAIATRAKRMQTLKDSKGRNNPGQSSL